MSFSVELTGLLTKPGAMNRLSAEMRKRVDREVGLSAQRLAKGMRDLIQKPGTGEVYDSIFATINGRVVPVGPRSGNNLSPSHRASAPKEPPATDTGGLIESIAFQKTGDTYIVGSKLKYARFLEFGTQRMIERPFMRPAIRTEREELLKRMVNLVGAKRARLTEVSE